jgi:hypothetical protein
MSLGPPYNIDEARISWAGPDVRDKSRHVVVIDWAAKGIGFGQITIAQHPEEGPAEIESECMGTEFVQAVLARLAAQATIVE